MKAILISSSGGHWIQLNRLSSALDGLELVFASTDRDYGQFNSGSKYYYIPDASRWNKWQLLKQAFSVLALLLKEKPDVVITTGASVGFFAVFFAKYLKIKSIWVDSIANAEELSLSGVKASKYAHLFITQWEHLEKQYGAKYFGSVI